MAFEPSNKIAKETGWTKSPEQIKEDLENLSANDYAVRRRRLHEQELAERKEHNTKPLWARLQTEKYGDYEKFIKYRDFGPDRTITKVVDKEYEGKYTSGRHRKSLITSWKWNVWPNHWVERARAWDDALWDLNESKRIEVEIAAAEKRIKKDIEERDLVVAEGRKTRDIARKVLDKFLACWDEGEFAEMGAARVKTSRFYIDAESGEKVKTEYEVKSIVEILPLAIAAMVAGQAIENRYQNAANPQEQKHNADVNVEELTDEALVAYVRDLAKIG